MKRMKCKIQRFYQLRNSILFVDVFPAQPHRNNFDENAFERHLFNSTLTIDFEVEMDDKYFIEKRNLTRCNPKKVKVHSRFEGK